MLTKKLKNLRTIRNLTQAELAKKLEISRVRYNNYETGKRSPDYETLHQIADFFGVTTDYLLGRNEYLVDSKPLSISQIIDFKSVDQELDDLLQKIQSSCTELIFRGEALDEITKTVLFNSLKNVMEMVDKMHELKKNKA